MVRLPWRGERELGGVGWGKGGWGKGGEQGWNFRGALLIFNSNPVEVTGKEIR